MGTLAASAINMVPRARAGLSLGDPSHCWENDEKTPEALQQARGRRFGMTFVAAENFWLPDLWLSKSFNGTHWWHQACVIEPNIFTIDDRERDKFFARFETAGFEDFRSGDHQSIVRKNCWCGLTTVAIRSTMPVFRCGDADQTKDAGLVISPGCLPSVTAALTGAG